MKWPFMWKSTAAHQLWVKEQRIIDQKGIINVQEKLIARLESDNASLTSALTVAKCNDYTPKLEKTRNPVPSDVNTRGGWRHKAESASISTIPAVPDSQAQLEERVKAQGGLV